MRKNRRLQRKQLPPGAITRRFLPVFHYELFVCGIRGHLLVGFAADATEKDPHLVRRYEDINWHRCLRCDAWIPLASSESLPGHVRARSSSRESIELPLRGRALRDKIVTRLIAIKKGINGMVLASIATALFLVAGNRDELQEKFRDIVKVLQPAVDGSKSHEPQGVTGLINDILSFPTYGLYLLAIAVSCYVLIEMAQSVGLWMQKRWAAYLTVVATSFFIPYEIYEIISRASWLKFWTFVANVLIVLYLMWTKRLWGLRGGYNPEEMYPEDEGWVAVERATPPYHPEPTPATDESAL